MDKSIETIGVKNKEEGARAAFELLKGIVNSETAMFLSGGGSPRDLYRLISQDKNRSVKPVAFCTVDERWVVAGSPDSNEQMIASTGLYEYAAGADIEVHKILGGILNRSETALRYGVVLDGIFARIHNSVSIMGIGTDGHTAGIAPYVTLPLNKMVVGYLNDQKGWQFPERITITAVALKRIDEHIILAFGEDKKDVLKRFVGQKNNAREFPAEVFKEIDRRVYLITDQKVCN